MEIWRRGISGFGTVIDLEGCSFGLNKNDVCDVLLCKFRCAQDNEPEKPIAIGKHLCPRNNEYVPRVRNKHEKVIVNG